MKLTPSEIDYVAKQAHKLWENTYQSHKQINLDIRNSPNEKSATIPQKWYEIEKVVDSIDFNPNSNIFEKRE